jgi:hypothetical protein
VLFQSDAHPLPQTCEWFEDEDSFSSTKRKSAYQTFRDRSEKCARDLPTSRPPYLSWAEFRALEISSMNENKREKLLKAALVIIGALFLLIYPLGLVWPSGWLWHGGEGKYYFYMICAVYAVLGLYLIGAARNPRENASLISFAIWSSLAHAGVMAAEAIYDQHERAHLVGDVPALVVVAAVLWILSPTERARRA